MSSLERRITELEELLRPSGAILDCRHGDPEELIAAYHAATPPDQRARMLVVLVDPRRKSQ